MLPFGNGNERVPLWPVSKLASSERLDQIKSEHRDSSLAEYQRLLYVAMTRARDELYICGYRGAQDPKPDCWYKVIEAGLDKLLANVGGAEDGKRFGLAPVYHHASPFQAEPKAPLPDWVTRPVTKRPMAETTGAARATQRAEARVARGILIHRILQQVCEIEPAARPDYIAQTVARSGYGPELAEQLTVMVLDERFREVFWPDGVSEVPVLLQGPDGTPERRRIDRLVFSSKDLLLVDYKTDRYWPHRPEEVDPDYLQQLAAYRNALRDIYGTIPMRFALLWTEAPSLMVISDDLLDRIAGQLPVNRP
jgi:ATP-dependent helicase/nuclease subunit A